MLDLNHRNIPTYSLDIGLTDRFVYNKGDILNRNSVVSIPGLAVMLRSPAELQHQ